MARTNVCKECGTTDGPWVGTNHNLCKPCADARPKKPEPPALLMPRSGAAASLIGAALLGVMASQSPVKPRGKR